MSPRTTLLPVLFLALNQIALSANSPSIFVNAGRDTTIRAKYSVNLYGSVTTAIPDSQLHIAWKQVAPDAPLEIIRLANQDTCNVAFGNDTGTFAFELSASDGQSTSRDTVLVHVLPNLPFQVLAPAANEVVQLGQPYTIRWQMDPPYRCRIAYVSGFNSQDLGVAGGQVISQFTWIPDPAIDTLLNAVDTFQVVITQYGSSYSTVSGPFTLTATGAKYRFVNNHEQQFRIAINKDGSMRACGLPEDGIFLLTVFDPVGRLVPRKADSARFNAFAGLYVYQFREGAGPVRSGKILSDR